MCELQKYGQGLQKSGQKKHSKHIRAVEWLAVRGWQMVFG